ncbi:MAG: hypothetical protein JNG44_02185 [Porphyromonas sp.]|uniref:hypothetical protein n=1 Tax=Porphyromonas sp. TaxID=1924944 RepID=UPI001A41C003|nr:hypothetical protein [Porphyromonas sp.]MBL6452499.1 hypothetical protein [Porphyromonas sp.]
MKYMKMAAIAMMALALFSCNKKDEPKNEDAILRIRINDSQLRTLEGSIATGDKTECMTDVVLTLDNGEEITLDATKLAQAKTDEGYKQDVTHVVNTVALTANGKIEATTDITTLQGKIIKTEGIQESDYSKVIPLAAEATQVEVSTVGDKTVYTVTLEPKPAVARLEVFGKITPKDNNEGKNAFESITVERVYVNNYLSTIAGTRHMCVTNGKDGFAADPALQDAMNDEIKNAELNDFVAGDKVAGYQLFPKKAAEKAEGEFFDHVILKLNIKYTQAALDAKPELKDMTQRYVTIVRFMKEQTKDLDGGFEAGMVYKLNLDELSKDFKTGDDGTPDPNNPDTPDPEPNQKKQLVVKVKPYTWTAVNIKPDVDGNGYKK